MSFAPKIAHSGVASLTQPQPLRAHSLKPFTNYCFPVAGIARQAKDLGATSLDPSKILLHRKVWLLHFRRLRYNAWAEVTD